jgi:hypothetical protein
MYIYMYIYICCFITVDFRRFIASFFFVFLRRSLCPIWLPSASPYRQCTRLYVVINTYWYSLYVHVERPERRKTKKDLVN